MDKSDYFRRRETLQGDKDDIGDTNEDKYLVDDDAWLLLAKQRLLSPIVEENNSLIPPLIIRIMSSESADENLSHYSPEVMMPETEEEASAAVEVSSAGEGLEIVCLDECSNELNELKDRAKRLSRELSQLSCTELQFEDLPVDDEDGLRKSSLASGSEKDAEMVERIVARGQHEEGEGFVMLDMPEVEGKNLEEQQEREMRLVKDQGDFRILRENSRVQEPLLEQDEEEDSSGGIGNKVDLEDSSPGDKIDEEEFSFDDMVVVEGEECDRKEEKCPEEKNETIGQDETGVELCADQEERESSVCESQEMQDQHHHEQNESIIYESQETQEGNEPKVDQEARTPSPCQEVKDEVIENPSLDVTAEQLRSEQEEDACSENIIVTEDLSETKSADEDACPENLIDLCTAEAADEDTCPENIIVTEDMIRSKAADEDTCPGNIIVTEDPSGTNAVETISVNDDNSAEDQDCIVEENTSNTSKYKQSYPISEVEKAEEEAEKTENDPQMGASDYLMAQIKNNLKKESKPIRKTKGKATDNEEKAELCDQNHSDKQIEQDLIQAEAKIEDEIPESSPEETENGNDRKCEIRKKSQQKQEECDSAIGECNKMIKDINLSEFIRRSARSHSKSKTEDDIESSLAPRKGQEKPGKTFLRDSYDPAMDDPEMQLIMAKIQKSKDRTRLRQWQALYPDLCLEGERMQRDRRHGGPLYWNMPFRHEYYGEIKRETLEDDSELDPHMFAPTGNIYSYFQRRTLKPAYYDRPTKYQIKKA